MVRNFLSVLVLLIISGCTATGGLKNVENLDTGARIVVVSALGDDLAIEHTGTTILQNASEETDVSEWALDGYAESYIRATFRQARRFNVIDHDTTEARRRIGPVEQSFWTGAIEFEGGADNIIALGSEADADYILYIGAAELQDPFFDTARHFSGYGITQRSAFGFRRGVHYVFLHMVLLDATTGEQVARTTATADLARPNTHWLDGPDFRMSEETLDYTHERMRLAIQMAASTALRNLKLIN